MAPSATGTATAAVASSLTRMGTALRHRYHAHGGTKQITRATNRGRAPAMPTMVSPRSTSGAKSVSWVRALGVLEPGALGPGALRSGADGA